MCGRGKEARSHFHCFVLEAPRICVGRVFLLPTLAMFEGGISTED